MKLPKIKNGSSFKKNIKKRYILKFNRKWKWIKMEVEKKYKWKLHKIKNGSSFKKPLYLNYLFGN